MNQNYSEILNLALSGKNLDVKVSQINYLWRLIDEQRLFQFAKIDEVASHITYILKASDLTYASFWEKDYQATDQRISVLMDVLEEVASKLKGLLIYNDVTGKSSEYNWFNNFSINEDNTLYLNNNNNNDDEEDDVQF